MGFPPLLFCSFLFFFLFFCSLCFFHGASSAKEDSSNDGLCSALILPLGYPCIEYTTTTDDGYILGVQRISSRHDRSMVFPGPPVFLQHGLFQAGDTWFENTVEESLGFLLADAGFDVWVGNIRGTRWSHGHISMSKHSKEFWNWSWEELAGHDLPAMLELVYNVTQSQIYYVGHSQGTLIALASLTGERVTKMVSAAALLSPIAFLSNITSQFIRTAVNLQIDKFVKSAGIHQMNFRSNFAVVLADRICATEEGMCGDLLSAITGPNCCFNESRLPFYLKYEPHPSSTKNLEHYFQMIRKGTFSKFDYGPIRNLIHYGSGVPPAYDVSKIPSEFPLFIAFGGRDTLSDPTDVLKLFGQLSCNVQILYLEDYAHLDFVLSTSASIDLYSFVIEFFRSNKMLHPLDHR